LEFCLRKLGAGENFIFIADNIGLKGSLVFSELERRFFEATHKKSSDLEKIKFGWSRGATAPQGGTL
jgi:hypothetical protein